MRLADVEGEKAELTGMTAPGDPEGQLNPNIPDIDGELKEDGTARVFGMLSINVVVTLGIWVLWSDDLSGINSGEQLGKVYKYLKKGEICGLTVYCAASAAGSAAVSIHSVRVHTVPPLCGPHAHSHISIPSPHCNANWIKDSRRTLHVRTETYMR
jgi:hypothetical protein